MCLWSSLEDMPHDLLRNVFRYSTAIQSWLENAGDLSFTFLGGRFHRQREFELATFLYRKFGIQLHLSSADRRNLELSKRHHIPGKRPIVLASYSGHQPTQIWTCRPLISLLRVCILIGWDLFESSVTSLYLNPTSIILRNNSFGCQRGSFSISSAQSVLLHITITSIWIINFFPILEEGWPEDTF